MRLSSYGTMVEIARENLALALKCKEEINTMSKALESLDRDEADCFDALRIRPVKGRLNRCCLITIVFSALAVEGYIYDYAARNLTDNFVDSHLDKLDVISKWIIVTKLVTGKTFPKDGKVFQLLRQLIKNRNDIVHSKSKKLMRTDKGMDLTKEIPEEVFDSLFSDGAKKMLAFNESILDSAQEAITTLRELAAVMETLDPDEYTSARLLINSDL